MDPKMDSKMETDTNTDSITVTLDFDDDLTDEEILINAGITPDILFDPTQYRHIKRPPIRAATHAYDLYVTTSRHLQPLIKRGMEWLCDHTKQPPYLIIHGLGAAINTAVYLALQLQHTYNHPHDIESDIVMDVDDDGTATSRSRHVPKQRRGKKHAIHNISHPSFRHLQNIEQDQITREQITSQQLLHGMHQIILSPTTSTVTLLDDYEPLHSHLPHITLKRYNSAIHIKVERKPIPTSTTSTTGTTFTTSTSTSTSSSTAPHEPSPSHADKKLRLS